MRVAIDIQIIAVIFPPDKCNVITIVFIGIRIVVGFGSIVQRQYEPRIEDPQARPPRACVSVRIDDPAVIEELRKTID